MIKLQKFTVLPQIFATIFLKRFKNISYPHLKLPGSIIATDGTKIKSGDEWRDAIKASLISAKVNFLIITPNYKESEVCMNDMGAAWVTTATVLPLIVDPINYKTVGVIHEPTQVEKLLDSKSLDRMRDVVQEKLSIPASQIKSDRWTSKKVEFTTRVSRYIFEHPFEMPVDRHAFNALIQANIEFEKAVLSLSKERSELEALVNDLKRLKDKEQVSEVLKEINPSNQYQKFEELCGEVEKLLNQNNSIINGVIFRAYTRMQIGIDWQNHRLELSEAIADGYINEDGDVLWDGIRDMKYLKVALTKVRDFIDGDLEDDFLQEYDAHYYAPLDINNRMFWEEAFEVTIALK